MAHEQVVISEPGYMYVCAVALAKAHVYLSNEEEQATEVYFDDFSVMVSEGPVIQVNDYYPYGLPAYSWVREGEQEVKDKFQGKEYESKTGWYDFHARQYDPAIGRFKSVDPANQFASGYVGMGNNPVIGVDPDGQWVNFVIGAVVGAIGGFSTGKALGKSGWDLFAYTMAGAGIGTLTAGIGTTVTAGTSATLGATGSTLVGGTVAGAFNGAAMTGLGGGNIGQGALYGAIGGLAGSTAGLANINGIVPGALYGAGTGGLISGGISSLSGGSFGDGFRSGAISGGILGGINGGIAAAQSIHDRNILTGYIKRDYLDNYLSSYVNNQHPSWNHGRNVDWRARAISDMGRTTDNGNTVTIKRSVVKQHLLGRNINQLYLTAGHEAQHVGDFANGNMLRYRANFLSSHPNATHATVVNAMSYQSEINAYTWQLGQARMLNYRVAHYQGLLNHYQNLYNGL